MSIVQQGPTPDASATARGQVNTVAQTFAGDKTFNGTVNALALNLNSGNFNLPSSGALATYSAQAVAGAGINAFIAATGARWKIGGGTNDYFYSDGGLCIATPGYLWVTSGEGVFLNPLGTKRIYFDGTDIAANATFKVNGDLKLLAGSTVFWGTFGLIQSYYYGGYLGLLLLGAAANGAGHAALNIGNNVALAETEDLVRLANGTPDVDPTIFAIKPSGKIVQASTDSTGTPGAATINKPSGKSAIATGAQTCVVTNSLVSAGSNVQVTPLGVDTAAPHYKAVPAAGSFTVTSYNNAGVATNVAANWPFQWSVQN